MGRAAVNGRQVRSMPSAGKRIAGSLAAVAAFGLVLAPVLHAQLHASEAEQDELALARDDDSVLPEIEPDHHDHGGGGQHTHSHGPGPHGTGSLEHFALAVHAALEGPAVAPPERVRDRPTVAPEVLHLTPRYLVPQFSQGPPRA
jgi:hypothetical protein